MGIIGNREESRGPAWVSSERNLSSLGRGRENYALRSYRKLHLNQHGPRGDELDMLNAAGAEGWELVGITNNNIAYLKREIEDFYRPQTAAHHHPVASGSEPSRSSAGQVPIKYRDPVTNDTWSGRGRMANWLKRKQEAGEDIEEYLV